MRYIGVLATTLFLCLTLSLSACGNAADDTTDSQNGSMAPAVIDPTTPIDNAQETADDANAATDAQSSDIEELTDDE